VLALTTSCVHVRIGALCSAPRCGGVGRQALRAGAELRDTLRSRVSLIVEGSGVLRPVQILSRAGAALVIAAILQLPACLSTAASATSVADITKQVLAGADVALSGPSIVNLPDGTTTYHGVLSGHGILTVAGHGTLVMTKDSDFTLPAALQHQVVTTSGGNWPYPIVTDADQPAVIVDAGATLQYGNGGSSGIIGNYPYTQVSGLTLNQDNIEVNGTLNLDITNREFNLGTISGSGTLSQPRFTWGSLDLADDLPFAGTISNGTGMNFGSAAFRLSMPDVARVQNDGSAIISARNYTLVIPQNFYQDVYGSDINFHTWQAGLIVMTGVDHYADPALDTATLAHTVNYRGINIEGANVQWGNGTTGQFFLPATPQNSYINIHKDGSLAFDYDRPVTLDTPISGGKYQQSLSTPAFATITVSPTAGNDVTFATPMNYHGTTNIGHGAGLLLGTGSPGGDSSLLTGAAQDQIADDGVLIIRNTATPIQLSGISGSGSLTQAGSATTTLGSAIAYTGATTITKGTLALGPGASLASSSGVRLASASAVLDLTRAGGQSVRRLAGARGSIVRLGSGTLTVTTSDAAKYGGSITSTAGGGVITAGTGTLTLTGKVTTPSGTLKLKRGTLVLGPSATVSVRSLTEVRGAKLTVDLDAAAHRGGSPIITSNGAVRLSGKLALSLTSGRRYPARITLIHDSRARAIVGTFSGLRQSGAISVNGHKYLINYAADGGRDVTLTAASARASAAGPFQSKGARQTASGTLASVTKSAGLLSSLPAVTAALGLLSATVGAVLLLLRLRGNRVRLPFAHGWGHRPGARCRECGETIRRHDSAGCAIGTGFRGCTGCHLLCAAPRHCHHVGRRNDAGDRASGSHRAGRLPGPQDPPVPVPGPAGGGGRGHQHPAVPAAVRRDIRRPGDPVRQQLHRAAEPYRLAVFHGNRVRYGRVRRYHRQERDRPARGYRADGRRPRRHRCCDQGPCGRGKAGPAAAVQTGLRSGRTVCLRNPRAGLQEFVAHGLDRRFPVPGGRAQHGDAGRGEVVACAEHGVPGALGERVREAVAEVERGWMPSLAVSAPPAHRAGRQFLIVGDDVDLRITEKPLYDILPGRPESGLDDDAQLNPDGSGHQPDQGMLKVGGEILASRLAEDNGHARRRVNDKAPAALRLRRRLRQLGRPASS